MMRRLALVVVAAGLALGTTQLAESPGHAAGLSVDPGRVTVQVVANPPP